MVESRRVGINRRVAGLSPTFGAIFGSKESRCGNKLFAAAP